MPESVGNVYRGHRCVFLRKGDGVLYCIWCVIYWAESLLVGGSSEVRARTGRLWTLRQVRWWGGWAEGEHRDTLIKYLLDELYTYEDDYSSMLLPVQAELNASVLGEAVAIGPATTLQLSQFRQSISTDLQTAFVNSFSSMCTGPSERPQAYIQQAPGQFPAPNQISWPPFSSSTHALVPISLPTTTQNPTIPLLAPSGRLLPTSGLVVPDIPVKLSDGSTLHRRDSWRIAVQHWLEGEPAHGLFKPLKDWTKAELNGPNKPFAMKCHGCMVIATEFIAQYHSYEALFLSTYPEANEGLSKLLAAVNAARVARGNRIPRK
ncbi:hypothetical protein C8J57DRAFT_1245351 [Mycena rebaudengoi]|nr:hypothetical protein C8J57DRAFT_1245351 [Mycena rebaudengoi]